MSYFGETLFGNRKFIRWTLSPLVLLFAILMPFLINFTIEKWTIMGAIIMGGLELMCLTLLMCFWLPSRIGHWAFRVLAGLIFITYLSYLIYEYFFSNAPFRLSGSRGEPSPRNALLGFIFIGIPCFYYSLFGRFTLRPPPQEPGIDKLDDKSEDNIS
jgi:hypothetical protein